MPEKGGPWTVFRFKGGFGKKEGGGGVGELIPQYTLCPLGTPYWICPRSKHLLVSKRSWRRLQRSNFWSSKASWSRLRKTSSGRLGRLGIVIIFKILFLIKLKEIIIVILRTSLAYRWFRDWVYFNISTLFVDMYVLWYFPGRNPWQL